MLSDKDWEDIRAIYRSLTPYEKDLAPVQFIEQLLRMGIEHERKRKLRAAWDSTGNGPIKAIIHDDSLSTIPTLIDNPAPADCQPFEQVGPRYWRIKDV